MATLRKWLTDKEFDWDSGRIVVQGGTDGERNEWDLRFEATPRKGRVAAKDDPELDREFDDGLGTLACPHFVAEDDCAIYFASQYDGASECEKIYKDVSVYLGDSPIPVPVPGQ